MAAHPSIEVPDSCLWRVYAALGAAPQTQAQLRAAVGMTTGIVCRSLKFLVDHGYVRTAGKLPNRYGLTLGRPQILYERTEKTLTPPNIPDVSSMISSDDLAEVMADIVRLRLI
jgi:predicted ArsR family transcriptional regulator